MVEVKNHYAESYFDARELFCKSCETNKHAIKKYKNPFLGPNKEQLYTDTTLIGPKNAKKILIIVSATHGIEGFAGSIIQTHFLQSFDIKDLPKDTAILIIHSINPYGFAWMRRTTEDNVDLNRNFINHNKKPPENPLYAQLDQVLCPQEWSFTERLKKDLQLLYARAAYGARKMQEAVTKGQYEHPKGIFFGGKKATWSNKTLKKILKFYFKNNQPEVSVILDIHSGLGEFADFELISSHPPETKEFKQILEWYKHDITSPELDSSESSIVLGDLPLGIAQELGNTFTLGLTLEFGTYDKIRVLNALRADNWLQFFGDQKSEVAKEIKDNIKEAFYPKSNEWREKIESTGKRIIENSLLKLSTT